MVDMFSRLVDVNVTRIRTPRAKRGKCWSDRVATSQRRRGQTRRQRATLS